MTSTSILPEQSDEVDLLSEGRVSTFTKSSRRSFSEADSAIIERYFGQYIKAKTIKFKDIRVERYTHQALDEFITTNDFTNQQVRDKIVHLSKKVKKVNKNKHFCYLM